MVQTPPTEFSAYIQQLLDEINPALDRNASFDADCPAHLREAIRYSLLAPGKRLRPCLVLMAAEACGYDREAALPAACAVEMVHAYSLIHDDLPAMDDDDMRRGRPSCHAKFGEATAILAGDALVTLAFQVLAEQLPAETAARCCGELARAAGGSGMVGGQADDLAAEFSEHAGLEQLLRIHRRKTGAMIRVSLRLGGLVAKADSEQLQALSQYGEDLGLAFQIVDDLLDLQGDATQLGKRTGKDSQRGKLTYPSLLGADASRQRARELVDHACSAIQPFGSQAECLEALARFVLERNR